MKKLPIIILLFCVLFSAYFLWKANTYTKRAESAQAEAMRLQEVSIKMQQEVELIKQHALESAAEARLFQNKAEEAMRKLEACKK
ncbi:MAG: hypothetical protein R8G66_08005 [Cytophagales bacterium]|nr:hypothetical protein [Cytophagales bacterium]